MKLNDFTPESKRHGDKWARTMDEAFFPGARLHIEPDFDTAPFGLALVGVVILVGVLFA